MLSVLKQIYKFVDYNRYLCAAVVAGAVIALFAWGCYSTTPSPLSGAEVNRDQLHAEAGIYNAEIEAQTEIMTAKFESAYTDLDRQDEFRAATVSLIEPVVGPALGPYATTVFGLLSLGLGGDNIRKRSVIKRLKNGNPN